MMKRTGLTLNKSWGTDWMIEVPLDRRPAWSARLLSTIPD